MSKKGLAIQMSDDKKTTSTYIPEDESINTISAVIPIMTFIDLENVKEENECKVDYKIRNIFYSYFLLFYNIYRTFALVGVLKMSSLYARIIYNFLEI